jgi:hypothetical protein
VTSFTYHAANFRAEVIDQTFTRIGIENVTRRMLDCRVFIDYLRRTYPERDLTRIEGRSNEFYLNYLNELAERRNEVAHGEASELLSNELLLAYIDFFRAFGPALYEVVMTDIWPFEVKYRGIELGSPIRVFNNSIVCIAIQNLTIRVGDLLIARSADSAKSYVGDEIQEIQVDNERRDEVHASSNTKIAMRVTYHAKQNQTFFLVPRHK